MTDPDGAAIAWLVASDEPGIRYRARTELLEENPNDHDVAALGRSIAEGPKCKALLQFGDAPPYKKWSGAHWRLVSLAELGLLPRHPAADTACDLALDAWASDRWHRSPDVVGGLVRAHASVFGNALAVACRLGFATDPRAERLARSLCEWQWPDGGWNCDPTATRRSSFHESLAAAWGLIEYDKAIGEPRAQEAAARAAELFLSHRLFRSMSSGDVIHPSFVKFHWPPYWHYDILQALRVLGLISGALCDDRAADAFDVLAAARLSSGRWRTGGRWWRPPRSAKAGPDGDAPERAPDPGDGPAVEVIDWATTADEMVTFNALLARKLRCGGDPHRRPDHG